MLNEQTTDSLKSMVMLIAGEWRQGENLHQYRADSGAVLNWWKSTGTVTFQGPEAAAGNLKTAFLKFQEVKDYVKLWKKAGVISGALKVKLDNLFSTKTGKLREFQTRNPSKEVARKNAQRLRFLRFNRRPHPGPHYPSEQRRLRRPS
jgi:hypothetical protein